MAVSLRYTLAVCGNCDVPVRREDVLIEYEATDGRRAFAECPICRHVHKVDLPSCVR